MLGGPERRAPARRKSERAHNPIRTAWNIGFIFPAAFLYYGTAVSVLLFSSSVLAF